MWWKCLVITPFGRLNRDCVYALLIWGLLLVSTSRYSGKVRSMSNLSALIFNSLTAKSVPAGTKLILFGRYVLNSYDAKWKLGAPKSTYRHNAHIGEYRTILTSMKKIWFWPSTHAIDEESFVKIARNSWQAEVIARSTRYQTLQTDKNSRRYHARTKLAKQLAVRTANNC